MAGPRKMIGASSGYGTEFLKLSGGFPFRRICVSPGIKYASVTARPSFVSRTAYPSVSRFVMGSMMPVAWPPSITCIRGSPFAPALM